MSVPIPLRVDFDAVHAVGARRSHFHQRFVRFFDRGLQIPRPTDANLVQLLGLNFGFWSAFAWGLSVNGGPVAIFEARDRLQKAHHLVGA